MTKHAEGKGGIQEKIVEGVKQESGECVRWIACMGIQCVTMTAQGKTWGLILKASEWVELTGRYLDDHSREFLKEK